MRCEYGYMEDYMKNERNPDNRERISDGLMIVGGLLLSAGAGMVEPAAGVIVAGIVSIVYGIFVASGGRE